MKRFRATSAAGLVGALLLAVPATAQEPVWTLRGPTGAAWINDIAIAAPCVPSQTRLCLIGNRYAVDLVASRRGESRYEAGTARPFSDRGGFFALPFATGDPDLPEVVVKMLGHGALGIDGSPIFYASLTTLPYVLTVTDTVTGEQQTYRSNTDRPLCGQVDVAFEALPAPFAKAKANDELRLLSNRFAVTLEARHPQTGATAVGHAIEGTDRFGFFTLPGFTSDPTLPEVIVKMLDFR